MTVVSEDKDADQYAAKFGKKDGQIVRKLTEKVVNLTKRWQMFLYFFSGPRERVNVLNEASAFTASIFQGLLWDNVLLCIRQLTDGAESGGSNLSLERFKLIAGKASSVDLTNSYEIALIACKPARLHATKYLAHLDLDHALGKKVSKVRRTDTTAAIKAICLFAAEFHLTTTGAEHSFEMDAFAEDERQFLLRLYQGNRAEKDLEAASLAAAKAGDWGAINRPDIPDWITEKRGPMDLF